MRGKPNWGAGTPLAAIEERRLLRYRRVVVPANRAQWYRTLFEGGGLFRPRRSCPHAATIGSTGRRTVLRFDEPAAPSQAGQDGGGDPAPTSPRGRILAAGNGAETAPGAAGLVLKEERYPFPALFHGLVTVPRAEREFHNLLILRSLGFPAVEPLACGHSGLWILYHRSFLITRELSGGVSLKAWWKGDRRGISSEELAAALLGLVSGVARLHRARYYVRTLYGKNLLARKGPAGEVELTLCDVPRLWWFQRSGLSFRLASRDLACLDKWARLIYSPRQRLLFLKRYLEALGEGPPLRQWARRIARQGERMRHLTLSGRASKSIKQALKRLHLLRYWPF